MVKKYFKKLLSSFIFSVSGIFTLLFFSPLEIYLGNPADFRVYIDSAVLILALISLAVSLIFSAIVSFLPVKTLKILNLAILGVTLCYYIQSLFLNSAMNILTGEDLNVSVSTKLVNALIWLLIFCTVFVIWFLFKKLRKEKTFVTATKFVAVALVIMQLTGFLSMYIGYDKSVNVSKSLYYSAEGQLELSDKNNVVYFVIDYCDTSIVNNALKEDPELFSEFNGFTYYADNVFTHGRSYPAITYLLSGEKCYYDTPYKDYVDNAMNNSKFMKSIDELDTDIRLYTNPVYANTKLEDTKAKDLVDNCKIASSTQLSAVNFEGFLKQSIKISAFRGMPYAFKNIFAYDTETVNERSLISNDDFAPINNDLAFYDAICTKKLSVNNSYSSSFRFYHMFGSHPGAVINENAEYQEGVSLQQALRGDLKIIKAYINQLKELGVYDNTTIIITADHGEFRGYLAKPQTCLLLIKKAGADTSKPLITSNAPVCHEDLFPTVIKALGGDYESFGTPIEEISETQVRKRYHYNTEINLNDQTETVLKEYVIEGYAGDLKNYTPTGREWKINFTL